MSADEMDSATTTTTTTDSPASSHSCTLTPYCFKLVCKQPRHHELLEVLASITHFTKEEQQRLEKTIEKYEKEGVKKDDAIPDPEPEYRFPLLHWACALAKVSVVKYLIVKEGYNPNTLTPQRDTPVHRAITCLGSTKATKGKQRQMDSLLNLMPGNISVVNAKGQTPLLMLVDMLIRRETSSQFFSDTIRAITECAIKLSPDERNKALNTQNKHGNTALHLMVQEDGMLADIKKLVEAKCKLNIENKSGLPALFLAERLGNHDYVKVLCSHMPSCMTSRRLAPRSRMTHADSDIASGSNHYFTRSPSKRSPLKQVDDITRKRCPVRDDDNSEDSLQHEDMKRMKRSHPQKISSMNPVVVCSERSDAVEFLDRDTFDDETDTVAESGIENGSASVSSEDSESVSNNEDEDDYEDEDTKSPCTDCVKCTQIKTEALSPGACVGHGDEYKENQEKSPMEKMCTSGLLRYLTMSPSVKQELSRILQTDKDKLEDMQKELKSQSEALSSELLDVRLQKQAAQTRIVDLLKELEKLQSEAGDLEKKEFSMESTLKKQQKQSTEIQEKLKVLNEGLKECQEWK